MTHKSSEQKRTREIQKRTGWSYSEALRLVRLDLDDAAIGELIKMRGTTSA
jgi:hypothetical protein